MIKIALLGSTGSVGSQTLDVIRNYRDLIKPVILGASKPSEKLKSQVLEFCPEYVYIKNFDEEIFYGSKVITESNIEDIVSLDVDIYINAVSGIDGIKPTYLILNAGKKLATANKESIVCLGEMLKDKIKTVLPIDSEHSAIYQILKKEDRCVNKIILTASGGPFLHKPLEEFQNITVKEALNHPRWSMGKKITVDSATLMNKGFEVLEAHYLFGYDYEKIDVIIHPESIIHGMVEFCDGTVISNMSCPDMRIPISYAIFGERKFLNIKPLKLYEIGSLTFYKPDYEKFPLLKLAVECGKLGGSCPIVLTVADEVAVNLFLEGKIQFTDIHRVITQSVEQINIPIPSNIDELLSIIDFIKSQIRVID
ncbi:MAG: 1-deoxy-D-xylulose-5-phosphate reductoisomerase [Hydrogenothermaceae bacterium]